MAKPRTLHVCQSCGHESARWLGRCPGCSEWNSFVEEVREPAVDSAPAKAVGYGAASGGEAMRLTELQADTSVRRTTGYSELDRVLGGGFVAGQVVMLGGDPGIGKSTLSLQIAGKYADGGNPVLYLSGEESLGQLKMRAERLGVRSEELWVALETRLERAEQLIAERKPSLVIIDSIQTLSTDRLTSAPGSVAQLREVTGALTQRAKALSVPVVLIGHVTKEGAIAGPKVLEHMVDTVLYFESPSGMSYRVLRAVKNRFGSTNEIGVFEMQGRGLEQVANPSAAFLEGRPTGASGSVVVPVVEGTRPLLVEIQALVSATAYGPPRINAVGVESGRVAMVLNILEKRTGVKVAGMDVFVNVTGGVRVSEPAADLGVAVAIFSSFLDRAVPAQTLVFGELGLTGELRAVPQALPRLSEATKLGFDNAVLPASNQTEVAGQPESVSIGTSGAAVLSDALRAVFGADVF